MAIFAVTTERGPRWDPVRSTREQDAWEEHAAFADDLVQRGIIIVGGPVSGGDNDIALLAVNASDEAELQRVFSQDPWTLNGVFRIKDARSWEWWLDGRIISHE
jgi:uncharacterized protein